MIERLKRYHWWILAFLGLNLCDWLITFLATRLWDFHEANPVQNLLMVNPALWTISKLMLIPAVVVLATMRLCTPWVLKALGVGLLAVVLFNCYSVLGGTHYA